MTPRFWQVQRRLAPYLFLAPFLLLFVVFTVYPLISSFVLSLHTTAGPGRKVFVGLDNFRFLVTDKLFWAAAANTALFAGLFVCTQVPLSLGLAMLLNSKRIRARGIFRFAFFSTHLVGGVFVAVLFALVLSPRQGLLHRLLHAIAPGIELDFFSEPNLALVAVLLAALWLSVGYGMVYFLAALQAVEKELHEAARVDGASRWSRFWHVTIPGIRPVLRFMVLVGTIASLQLFELPWVLFQSSAGPGSRGITIVMYLYLHGFKAGDLGYASAIGWGLLALISVFAFLQIRAQRWGTEGRAVRRRAVPPLSEGEMPRLRDLTAGQARRGTASSGTPALVAPPAGSPSPMRLLSPLLLHGILLLLAALTLLPLAWMICASFKRGEDLFTYLLLPPAGRLTLDNYRALFRTQPYARWLLNSLFLASLHTVLVVTLCSLGGFALAKYRFAGKRLLGTLMLVSMMLPAQVLLLGNYELMHRLGWIDSYRAVLLPGLVSVFGLLLYRQAMRAVPDELLLAARVDGCSELGLWWRVALPLVRPMTGAFTLMSFLAAWNNFLWPSVILQDEGKYTLTLGLANLLALPEYRLEFGVLMAGTLLAILPVTLLFFALQRDFVSGLTSGAVRG